MTYNHGGMDFGEIHDDRFHGKGTAKYSNGDVFNELRTGGVMQERVKKKKESDHWFPVNKPEIILI